MTAKTECWWCENYSLYHPRDKKVLSPRQIENRAQRKEARKAVKNSEASKRGRRNKRAGKRAEKSLETLFQDWGYDCRRVPLSGSLKATGLVSKDDSLAGDLKLKIDGHELRIEVKKRANLNRYYRLVENHNVRIDGFCTLMAQENFMAHLQGNRGEIEETEDRQFKTLHDWFAQDNSQIVAMKQNRRDWIFAVKDDANEILLNSWR